MQTILRRLPNCFVVTVTVLLICALPVAYIAIMARAASGGAAWDDVLTAVFLTLLLAIGAAAIVSPFSLAYGLAAYDMKPTPARRVLLRAVYLLGGVPPAVCALAVIVPVIALGGRPSPFWALVALTLGCLPRSMAMYAGAVRAVPERYILAGMSLGASRRDATLGIALSFARGRLIASALVVCTLAIDQLALMQLALGFAPTLVPSSTHSLAPLLLYSAKQGDMATAAVCALTLIALSCSLSLAARLFAGRPA